MGVFDFFKKEQRKVEKADSATFQTRKAVAEKTIVNIEDIGKTFIAFDVETTGLNPASDRIVEIGAVLFVDGVPVKSFGTLVNPRIKISPSAAAINNITNNMLRRAPSEKEVYSQLLKFLGDALHGQIIMCAHNADFDFGFLRNTLSRLGYDPRNIRYVDTLSLSRKYIKGIRNYKLATVGEYFGLKNDTAHRAEADAELCGKILCGILNIIKGSMEERLEKSMPNKEELEVGAFIQNIIAEKGYDISSIRFTKNSNNYVDVTCLYSFLKFKFAKKGSYIIVKKTAVNGITLPIEPCTAGEGGTTNVRVYFQSPFDLEPLSSYILTVYSDCYYAMEKFMNMCDQTEYIAEYNIYMLNAISKADMEALLLDAKKREYKYKDVPKQIEQVISREDVVITGTHNRVPLNEIKNIADWDKGFEEGYPHWESGEAARKKGDIDEAIILFDRARYNGYAAPALYDSYAKAYRKIKDYDNEILILEEALLRKIAPDLGVLEARRNKAIKLLFTKQEAARRVKQKANKM